jgi:hypothetical protein
MKERHFLPSLSSQLIIIAIIILSINAIISVQVICHCSLCLCYKLLSPRQMPEFQKSLTVLLWVAPFFLYGQNMCPLHMTAKFT